MPLATAQFAKLVDASAERRGRGADYAAECRAGLAGLTSRHAASADALQDWLRSQDDREFFEFVTNGVAAIESLSYAAYAAGAVFWPQAFPFGSEAARQAVGPRGTARAYDIAGNQQFALRVYSILDSSRCRAWYRVRSVLSHRSLPEKVLPGVALEMEAWLTGALTDWLAGLTEVAEAQQ